MPHEALILVEGETEIEFYAVISEQMLHGVPKRTKNLRGTYNIHTRILDKVAEYSQNHPHNTFDLYICIDQEREGTPPYNDTLLASRLTDYPMCLQRQGVIARLMIESLFFIDIDGIYGYLRTPRNKRSKKKYANFRVLTHTNLSQLFRQYGKIYQKGHRCQHLVQGLDIEKIKNTAEEIQSFVATVQSRHESQNSR